MLKWAAISFSRGSFPTQGSNPHLLHWPVNSWQLSPQCVCSVLCDFATPWTVAHKAPLSLEFSKARILDWVVTSFSRGSSPPRDWTLVSSIAGRFFTTWVIRESTCSAGDWSLIPGSGRSPGEGNDCPLQYSCLEIPQTEKPGGLQSMGSQELDMTEWLTFVYLFQPPGKPINFLHFAWCLNFCVSKKTTALWVPMLVKQQGIIWSLLFAPKILSLLSSCIEQDI